MPANPTPLDTQPHTPFALLLPQCLGLPPPVIGIRIEHEHAVIREHDIEDVAEEEENHEGDPLQPDGAPGSHVVRRKGNEGEEENERERDPLTDDCDGHNFYLVVVGKRGTMLWLVEREGECLS